MGATSAVEDRVVWVTGASSGIGEALAVELSALGAKVVLSARRRDDLERVAARCASETLVRPLDLADMDDADRHVAAVLDRFGHVDVLVNNGGVSQRSLAADTPLSVDRQLMEVDFFGQVALTKAVLPHLMERGDGHIVAVSSLTGRVGIPLRSAYSAAKHAIHGFFDTLRLELSRSGIAVTIVCPPNVRTSISTNAITASGEPYSAMDRIQERGMASEQCARRIARALRRRPRELHIGAPVRAIVLFDRLLPGLLFRLLRRQRTFV